MMIIPFTERTRCYLSPPPPPPPHSLSVSSSKLFIRIAETCIERGKLRAAARSTLLRRSFQRSTFFPSELPPRCIPRPIVSRTRPPATPTFPTITIEIEPSFLQPGSISWLTVKWFKVAIWAPQGTRFLQGRNVFAELRLRRAPWHRCDRSPIMTTIMTDTR